MLVSRLVKVMATTAGMALLPTAASAGCGGSFCNSATLAPLSSYGSGSASSFGSGSAVGVASSQYASATYGSGSISQAYTAGGANVVPFSTSRPAGLGANEQLVPTNCPVNVHNPSGARVLGCYSIVKPRPAVPVTNFVRVVRPIVYVRYAVPYAVPGCTRTVVTNSSRYGGFGGNACGL